MKRFPIVHTSAVGGGVDPAPGCVLVEDPGHIQPEPFRLVERPLFPNGAGSTPPPTAWKAFTLVELLVAVTLIAILAGLLIPYLQQRERPRRRCACLSNVRQIGLAFKQYAVDNKDEFPSMTGAGGPICSTSVFPVLTNGNYLAVGKIYICPQDKSRAPGTAARFTTRNNSYACVVSNRTGRGGLTEGASSDNPLILDHGLWGSPGYVRLLNTNHWAKSPHGLTDGGNVLYVGGQAAFKKVFDCGADGTNGFILEP